MNTGKVGIIIEARSNSSRLKNKHFLKIKDKPIIFHMIERLKLIKNVDEIIIATTSRKDDRKFIKICTSTKIKIFRGSEKNVMKRVLDAARKFKLQIICEITGDCPFVDYEIVENLINKFQRSNFDYFSMKNSGYPHGVGAQLFTLQSLVKSYKMVKSKYDLEHVTSHFKRNKKKFKISYVKAPKKLKYPSIKLLLDEKLDYLFLNKLFLYFYKKKNIFFKTKDIVNVIKRKKITLDNFSVKRNAIT
jgi:spore coat polysaccharide biosynthesis protein SpsF